MSDQTIREGDLFMTVRLWPCCGGGVLGAIRVAGPVRHSKPHGIKCGICGFINPPAKVIYLGAKAIQYERCKKINPPALETETERETEAM